MKRTFTITLATVLMIALLFTAVPETNAATVLFKVGDYLKLGEYNGKEIIWRCVDVDSNGSLMLADEVLCKKPFDVPGMNTDGSHGRGFIENNVLGADRQTFGSNYWGDSNIRCWLNSEAKAGEVIWTCGNDPMSVSGYSNSEDNAYDNEAGFLSGFSEKELLLIKNVSQKQLLSAYEYSDDNTVTRGAHEYVTSISNCVRNYKTAYSEKLSDRIFLLDVNQINRVYKKRGILGEEYYIGKDDSGAQVFTWLRSPYTRIGSNFVRFVDTDGMVKDSTACNPYIGVRPAFYINSDVTSFGGYGTEKRPYFIGENPYEDIVGMEIGDYLTMGSYNGEKLTWRCASKDNNGFLMLCDKIFLGMEFDAKGNNIVSGSSHERSPVMYVPNPNSAWGEWMAIGWRSQEGSNYWGDSNLRCWLSSTERAGNVKWTCANPPSYKDKAGFLSEFSELELFAIKEVEMRTLLDSREYHADVDDGNSFKSQLTYPTLTKLYEPMAEYYDNYYNEILTEKMFIPDLQQIYSIFINEDLIYDGYTKSVEGYRYWLRTPNGLGRGSSGFYVCAMDYEGKIAIAENAGKQGSGAVRPSFYLNIDELVLSGKGSDKSPYEVKAMKNTDPTPDEHMYASVFASGFVPFLICATALLILSVIFVLCWLRKHRSNT